MGYFVAFIFEYITVFWVLYILFVILTFTLKTLMNLISLAKDLKAELIAFEKNDLWTLKKFNEFIQFHINVKQLSVYPLLLLTF